MLLGVELDKLYQMADWRIRPLPNGMQDYARSDTHYLIPAYFVLMSLFERQTNLKLFKSKTLDDFSKLQNNFIETLSKIENEHTLHNLHSDFQTKMNDFSLKCQFYRNNFKTIDIKVLNKEVIEKLQKPGELID